MLWWIHGRGRDFWPFGKNYIGEIQISTEPAQWQPFIHSMENIHQNIWQKVQGDNLKHKNKANIKYRLKHSNINNSEELNQSKVN